MMNFHLKLMLDELRIPASDQQKLATEHGIIDYETLKSKQYQLDRKQLEGVQIEAQRIVAAALVFLDSLDHRDPIKHFKKNEFEIFAVSIGGLPSTSEPTDHEGGQQGDGADPEATSHRRVTLESDEVDVASEVVCSSGDAMEIDAVDQEDLASRMNVSRKKSLIKGAKSDDELSVNEGVDNQEKRRGGMFDMIPQGFDPGESSLFAIQIEKPDKEDEIELDAVFFNGHLFRKGKCYYYEDNGESFLVGIKSFKSKKTARCVRIEHISKTFLGCEDDGEFQKAIAAHYPSKFAQIGRARSTPLSKLGDESTDPEDVPELVYEPQTNASRMSLAYVKDNDGSNRIRVPRKEIRLIEGFSGAGGMHIGYEEEGFTTVRAIEYNEVAVKTFEHNNPGVPTYCGDIRKFIQLYEEDEDFRKSMGRIDSIHTSSPCQGFSKANRYGGKNDDANNELSFTFPHLLKITGALVGVFENVEGMWSQKGMSYLRKILIDCIAMGYQVRVRVLHSCDYGDPQKRPRLIIIAAKNFVLMPDHPAPTHGTQRGLKPFTKCKDVLEYLRTPQGKKLPNMNILSQSKSQDIEKLFANRFAPAMRASCAQIMHYAEDRCISVREAAALQSFPLDYEFLGTLTEQVRQVGNAVPIELSRSIARSVRESLRHFYAEEFKTSTNDNNDREDEMLTPAVQEVNIQDGEKVLLEEGDREEGDATMANGEVPDREEMAC